MPPPHRRLAETPEPFERDARDSDRSEAFFRELKSVKETAAEALGKVSEVYEGKLDAANAEIGQLRAQVTTLQAQATQHTLADGQLNQAIATLQTGMSATIATAVTLEVSKHFVTTKEATTISQDQTRASAPKLAGIAILLSAIVSGAVAGAIKGCNEPATPTLQLSQPPKQFNPNNPHGVNP